MKKLFGLLLVLLHTCLVNARCSSNSIGVFPSNYLMSQSSMIILTGYASSQDVINGLNTFYPVYLEGDGQKIKLLMVEKFVGEFNLTQVILKPETELQIGKEYILRIDNIESEDIPRRYNEAKKSYETPSYLIVENTDNEPPQAESLPIELNKSYRQFGCGPAINVTFSLPVFDKSEYVIKTTVRNLTTGKASTFCIEPYKNEIVIGHDMCSGAFIFGNYKEFEVTFAYVDVSGNTTAATPPIIFIAPKKNGSEDD